MSDKPGRHLAVAPSPPVRAFMVTTVDEAREFADLALLAECAPRGLNTREKLVVAMVHGAELDMGPFESIQSIAVIGNRPCLFGDAPLARCIKSGELDDIIEVNNGAAKFEDWIATCTIKRRGLTEAVRTFSYRDAKRAGLIGKQGPWSTSPKRMMQLRARSFALRDTFPDWLRGIGIAEEVRDIIEPTAEDLPEITATDLARQAGEDIPVVDVDIELTPESEPAESQSFPWDDENELDNAADQEPPPDEPDPVDPEDDLAPPAESEPAAEEPPARAAPRSAPAWLKEYGRQLSLDQTTDQAVSTWRAYREQAITAGGDLLEEADRLFRATEQRIMNARKEQPDE